MGIGAIILAVGVLGPAAKPCYPDEPKTVTLTGTLIEQTFPGPPNYESVAEGDAPETYFLLKFDPPVCTTGYTEQEMKKANYWDAPHSAISQMQLVFLNDSKYLYDKLRPYLGKQVQCKGRLFDAQTGHHHTTVLIQIMNKQDCRPVSM